MRGQAKLKSGDEILQRSAHAKMEKLIKSAQAFCLQAHFQMLGSKAEDSIGRIATSSKHGLFESHIICQSKATWGTMGLVHNIALLVSLSRALLSKCRTCIFKDAVRGG